MAEFLDSYINELLHLEDVETNKLIDLDAKDINKTLYVNTPNDSNLTVRRLLNIISNRKGKIGNTVLKDSASTMNEQIFGNDTNVLEWCFADGTANVDKLYAFIKEVYKDIIEKGTNTLFLSLGAIKWHLYYGNNNDKDVTAPLLIFPIKLIRGGVSTPVSIEFLDDDIYVNPALIKKLAAVFGENAIKAFPHPNGKMASLDEPVDLELLGNGIDYFTAIKEYVLSTRNASSEAIFKFLDNTAAISSYNHNEICMYYDILRNKKKIYENPLVNKIFTKRPDLDVRNVTSGELFLTLPYDSSQEQIIYRVVNGESLIIKGPPGTGKTQTITNIVTSLLGNGKKVLLASKKKSSLTEVYAKLPSDLKPFALLLEAENEKQTISISPSVISKELASMVKTASNYRCENHYDVQGILKDVTAGANNVEKYYNILFEKLPLGLSYYEILNIYFKNSSLPVIPFIDACREITVTPYESYKKLYDYVSNFEKAYLRLTDNEKHALFSSVWYGVKNDKLDEALNKLQTVVPLANKILDEINNTDIASYVDVNDLLLSNISYITESNITQKAIMDVLNSTKDDELLIDLVEAITVNKNYEIAELEQAHELYNKAVNLTVIGDVSRNIINSIYLNAHLFTSDNPFYLNKNTLNSITEVYEKINRHDEVSKMHEDKFLEIFKSDLSDNDKEIISKAYDTLVKYKDSTKPLGLFDGKAKKLHQELSKLSYLPNPTFKEIVDATIEFNLCNKEEEAIDSLITSLNKIFHKLLNEDELACLFYLVESSKENKDLKLLVNNVLDNYSLIKDIASFLKLDSYTVSDLINGLRKIDNYYKLYIECSTYTSEITDVLGLAKGIIVVNSLKNEKNFKYKPADTMVEVFNSIKANSKRIGEAINEFKLAFSKLSDLYNDSLYVHHFNKVKVSDLSLVITDAANNELTGAISILNELCVNKIINSIKNYLLHGDNIKLADYQYLDDTNRLAEIFEHSFYKIYIDSYLLTIKDKYNLSEKYNDNLDKLNETYNKLLECNKRIVKDMLYSSIDTNASIYQFLASNKSEKTLRALFKNHPDAIMNLKKCLILSPSTASILFRNEKYERFDVAIVDEASQLEPVNILPILFRCKQVVIVGDEWQMPPIVHFKKNTAGADELDEDYEAMPSLLSVSLKNEAFKAYELSSHFRSKTESLISFSQKEFYSFMRTFPSITPRIEGSLGFKDIYVEGATSYEGKNEMEADTVIEELKLHFSKYYNPQTESLSRSVGVVAFGTNQIDLIDKKIKADKELYKMVTNAKKTFVKETNNVEEKIFFLKTIETVQGQETDHLILSITYGVNKNGALYNHFGTLNQGDLGKCIFNVSVTRGKYYVTVIHSILAKDISDKLSFIRDYLNLVEYFSSDDKSQFISENWTPGFYNDIKKTIVSYGISEDRIVCNYGATKGSVRIPVVILSSDLKKAIGGIWAEANVKKNELIDYNIRYKSILKGIGWNFRTIYSHSWYLNNEKEKEKLKDYLMNL